MMISYQVKTIIIVLFRKTKQYNSISFPPIFKERVVVGGRGDPDISPVLPCESTALSTEGGVLEKYVTVGQPRLVNLLLPQTCDHCGEEFCHGECLRYHYEDNQVAGG